MGQDSIKNVRSFIRYEYYLLEQAMNGNCWIKLLDKKDSIEALRPLIVPVREKLYVYIRGTELCYAIPWCCMKKNKLRLKTIPYI